MAFETPAAAGAPATSTTETTDTAAPVSAERDVESLAPGSKEYTEWRMSGKLPKSSKETPASAASATAIEEEDEETAETTEAPPASSAATAAESQTAKPTEGKKAKQRYHELVDLIKQKEAEIAQLRQPKEVTAEKAASQAAAVEAAQTEANPEPGMDDVDPKTGKPKFQTIGDWLKARDQWLEDRLVTKSLERAEKNQKERMSQEQAREVTDAFRNRVEKAREKYADYDEVAGSETLPIPANSTMEAAIVLSEHGAEMTYLLGKNPAEAERISKLPPYQQAREMFLLELLAGGWDGLSKDQRFAPKLSASVKPKKITAVTSIPHEVGGSGQVLPDEVEQAANESEDDPQAVRRFIEADTRRAIARRKGK